MGFWDILKSKEEKQIEEKEYRDKYLEYLKMRKRIIMEKYEKEQLKKELKDYYARQESHSLFDDGHSILKAPNHFKRK